jgi:hypothetical protein
MELTKQLEGATPASRAKIEHYAAHVLREQDTLIGRTEVVRMRATPEEKQMMVSKAKRAGMTLTAYVIAIVSKYELGE